MKKVIFSVSIAFFLFGLCSSLSAQKVFAVQYESQADLKIYYVEYESQAGWNKNSKMHLMY